ncbi:SAM-dependent DNA methyltransferase, partial [candidate division KSB1 bacterium]
LPVTLWFFDKGKQDDRKDKILFIDARHLFVQVDRAHREFTPAQIEFLGNIVRLYRGQPIENLHNSESLTREHFPEGIYQGIKGLCKLAALSEVEAQGWSLNPGRYVGVKEEDDDGEGFYEKLEELNEELENLNSEARELEERIAKNISQLLYDR